MTKFRKITALEPRYKMLYEQFKTELNRFENFLKKESSPNSGKPSSYKQYLIRFLIHLEEIFNIKIH